MRQLGETLLEISSRHERLIDGLLTLAKSDRELGEVSYVDLADVVTHVAAQHPTVNASPGEAPTMGNAVLLERLVQNLVENGVRHNVPDGWVRVTTDTRPDGSAELVVTNTGPVVPPYEIPGLFEPFRRLTADRLATQPGVGLGLSIVRARPAPTAVTCTPGPATAAAWS
jgi:signal transduction histidine kinase